MTRAAMSMVIRCTVNALLLLRRVRCHLTDLPLHLPTALPCDAVVEEVRRERHGGVDGQEGGQAARSTEEGGQEGPDAPAA